MLLPGEKCKNRETGKMEPEAWLATSLWIHAVTVNIPGN